MDLSWVWFVSIAFIRIITVVGNVSNLNSGRKKVDIDFDYFFCHFNAGVVTRER